MSISIGVLRKHTQYEQVMACSVTCLPASMFHTNLSFVQLCYFANYAHIKSVRCIALDPKRNKFCTRRAIPIF